MTILIGALGFLLLLTVLVDAFETVVLPRTVQRRYRLSRLFYQTVWSKYKHAACKIRNLRRKDSLLATFGPLSLIGLLGLWAALLILAFAMLDFAQGSPFAGPDKHVSFATDLYTSGVTFFTLGYGDYVPTTYLSRFTAVAEAGVGFGFLAIVIGYLPVIYNAFSRREASISLLDARAGSPPTAAELLRRHALYKADSQLDVVLANMEQWASELLESHLSYPVLAFYRSQHDSQSWLAALTLMLDSSALILVSIKGTTKWQAQLTFAMARHALVDLSIIFHATPYPPEHDRLPPQKYALLGKQLAEAGLVLSDGSAHEQELSELRRSYEPYLQTLSGRFLLEIPPFILDHPEPDDWETSAWESTRHF